MIAMNDPLDRHFAEKLLVVHFSTAQKLEEKIDAAENCIEMCLSDEDFPEVA